MAMPPPSFPALGLGGKPRSMRRAAGDAGVQRTNDDAQATKMSCASLGYFRDDALPLLAKCLPSRKSPVINRGTWARHAATRQVTTDFVTACEQHAERQQGSTVADGSYAAQAGETATQQQASSGAGAGSSSAATSSSNFSQPVCQVVVLGAGSDSSWFSLQHQGWALLPAVHYIELDYHEMVSKKARTVLSTGELLQLLPDGTTATTAPAAAHATAVVAGPHTTWTKQEAAAAAAQPAAADTQQAEPGAAVQQSEHAASTTAAAAAATLPSHSSGPTPPAAVSSHVQELWGPRYSLVGVDLRHLEQLDVALKRAGFDARLPTLYLCECVLIYLEPREAQQLLAAAAQRAAAAGSSAAVAIYEQTRPDDAFGATMIENLEARGCPLRSVAAVPTPASQEARLMDTGWAAAAAADMAAIYHGNGRSHVGGGGAGSAGAGAADAGNGCSWLRPHWRAERSRIERLEMLDELEEWRLLQEHYCLAVGVTGEACHWLAEGLQLEQLRALGS